MTESAENVLVFIHCQHTNTQTGFSKKEGEKKAGEIRKNIKLLFDNGTESCLRSEEQSASDFIDFP